MTNPHDTPPQRTDDPPPEVIAALQSIPSSDYFASIAPLHDLVIGRRVLNSVVGHAGFILLLDDQSWVATFLHAAELRWARGTDADGLPGDYVEALFSPE